MQENMQSENVVPPVNFNNLALKQWLRDKGSVRRYEALRKLKAELQNLGLSRKQVYNALVQLTTKPRVILTRHTTCRNYGSKKSLEEHEKSIDANDTTCKANAVINEQDLRPQDEDIRKSKNTQMIIDRNAKNDEKMRRFKAREVGLSANNRFASNKTFKSSDDRTITRHPFDNALEQLDKANRSTKMNVDKLNDKHLITVLVSAAVPDRSLNKDQKMDNNSANRKSVHYRNENRITGMKDKSARLMKGPRDLARDKMGKNVFRTLHRSKGKVKSNLTSCFDIKETNIVKSEAVQELDSKIKYSGVQADSPSNQGKHAEEDGFESASTENKVTRSEENLCKRRLHETAILNIAQKKKVCISIVAREKFNTKRMNSMRHKFRMYFGDCRSMSEDEQERDILQRRLKRRRKKDSVDSCDSGVCLNEGNAISNVKETLKHVQTAVPDSTMHEEIGEDTSSKTTVQENTIDNSKDITINDNTKITNKVETTTTVVDQKESQNDMYIVENYRLGKHKITEEQSDTISEESNLVQSTTTSYIIQSSLKSEKTNISAPVLQGVDVESSISRCNTPIVCSSNCELDTIEDFLKSQTNNSDLKDLTELFYTNFEGTCQITSNGNVLSIQEKVKKDTNQNTFSKDNKKDLGLKKFIGTQTNDKQNNEQALNVTYTNSSISATDTNLCNAKKNIESVPVKISISNLLNNTNDKTFLESELSNILERKVMVSNSELNCVVQKEKQTTFVHAELNSTIEKGNRTEQPDSKQENGNTQGNKVPEVKLRVLSSAELGSRWCPTPINVETSTISEFPTRDATTDTATVSGTTVMYTSTVHVPSSSIVSQSVTMTVPIISTAASTFAYDDQTSCNIKKSNMDPQFSEAVHTALVNIYKLIQHRRSHNIECSKPLLREFEKLRKILNTENRINLINGIISILNKELLVHQPLSLTELLFYVPSFKSLYIHKSQEQINFSIDNSNGSQSIIPTVVSNKTTKQNMCNNSQRLQSTHTAPIPLMFGTMQTSASTNVTPKQLPQNFQDKVVPQSQNGLIQNSIPVNFTVTNCDMQQMNYKIPTQKFFPQQKVPNAYIIRQHPENNMEALQSFISHQFSSVDTNQPDIRYNQTGVAPIANTSFLHNYLSQATRPSNINVSNYSLQESINQTQEKNAKNISMPSMSQQFQNTIHRRPISNIPQGIQPQVVTQLPHNIPVINHTVQNTFVPNISPPVPRSTQQSEQVVQKVPAQVQSRISPNFIFKPVSLQQTQNISSSNTKQQKSFIKKNQNMAQISLEATVKHFVILEYLSDIQKIMLLNQMNFYFGCTRWLQQQFTPKKWQVIHVERSLLLHFQTLLKHMVEKIISDVPPNTSQSGMLENNIHPNIKVNIPKTVQIIVQENEKTHCQTDGFNPEEQSRIINVIDKYDKPNEEDPSILRLANQSANEQRTIDSASNKQFQNQTKKVEILQNEEIQKNKEIEKTLVQEKQSVITSVLKTQKLLNNSRTEKNILEKESENSMDLHSFSVNEQNLRQPIEIIKDVPHVVQKEVPITSDLKASYKDTLQHSNPHLVTVEISSYSDEITVINTNVTDETMDPEIKPVIEKTKEYEQPEVGIVKMTGTALCLEDNTSNTSKVCLSNNQDNIEYYNEADTCNTSLEGATISYIADVRSITLEAFEKMDTNTNGPTNNAESIIEEEEFKVCLVCGKPGTSSCSVCLEANYCSKECAKLHWEEHYQDCKPVKNTVYL